tara:strand:- start:401 stop:574 length:174 start_codon:yes stop_codon:yes gene_type:complete
MGLEYVFSAYGIWLGTFFIFIVLTKQKTKFTNKAITSLKQKNKEKYTQSKIIEKNEK